jgi:hypothetical protein
MLKWIIRSMLALPLCASVGVASATERVLLAPPAAIGAKSMSGATAKETVPGAIRSLSAKASRTKDARVRVVVGYRVPFAPEARLSGANRSKQQQEIAAAGERLRKNYASAARRKAGLQTFNSIPFATMEVTRKELDQLLADPNVLTIVEDQPMLPQLTHSVPLIGATAAWQAGATGAGQAVAVIDQGTQSDHPFLRDPATGKSKVIYEAACSGQVCTPQPGSAAYPPGSSSGSATHGTAVSGIIVGERPASAAGPALTGVAPGARLMVFRVYYVSDFLGALEKVYALRNQYKIAAVSVSLGMDRSTPGSCDNERPGFTAIINNLREAGIATVVAAGNNSDKSSSAGWTGATNRLMSPACISSAVSVGAIYPSNRSGNQTYSSWRCTFNQPIKVDEVACFSNTAPGLSLLAPGFPTETSSLNGSYNLTFGGTSAAAPHVAGAFALLRSKVPQATVPQMLEALRVTGKPVKDFRTGLVTPRIEIARALDYLQGNSQPVIAYSSTGDGNGTVSFSPAGSLNTCSTACTNSYPLGTKVTMTAQPGSGMWFLGWSGAGGECRGAETSCTLTLGKAMTEVSATFGRAGAPRPNHTLSYAKKGTGGGTLRATIGGTAAACATSCSTTQPEGTQVTLAAEPDGNSTFSGWSGACTGSAPTCTVTLNAAAAVDATFQPNAASVSFTLSYFRSGPGTVRATVNGDAATCTGTACSITRPAGTLVTLTAQPDANGVFTGWSGACSGTATTCTVTLSTARVAMANFANKPRMAQR